MVNNNIAVFLDRDGTINHDYGYMSDPENFELIHGVRAALLLLKEVGFHLFVVSNQSGVGRGLIKEKQLSLINKKMIKELAKGELILDDIVYCMHQPTDDCDCRKPSPKMVLDLAKKHHVNLTKSYFIGDKMLDIETGREAGCKSILLLKDDEPIEEDQEEWVDPDFVAENICRAVEWVLKDSQSLEALKKAIMGG